MRRSTFMLAASAACLAAIFAGGAHAATKLAYTEQAFQASEAAGKPILVHIEASWCPTCAKQRPILSELYTDPKFADLVVYDVDFDTQKDVVRKLGATMQSTLVAFHGTAEKARSTGDTNAASIKALVEKTVN